MIGTEPYGQPKSTKRWGWGFLLPAWTKAGSAWSSEILKWPKLKEKKLLTSIRYKEKNRRI